MASIRKLFSSLKSYVNYLNQTNPNIMVFICYGCLYDTVINLYKPFAVKFLQRIGGGSFYISLYNSIPGLVAALVLIPGVFFISKFETKKNVTSVLILIGRFCILSLAFIPLLPLPLQPLAFILIVSFLNLPEALSQTSMQGFLGNVFDGRTRSQAIALRNKFGNVAVPVIVLVTGIIISAIPKTNEQTIFCYQIFFVFAFIVGIFEIRTFRKFNETKPTQPINKPSISTMKKVLHDRRFLSFLGMTIFFQFAWQAGWPICSIYQVDNLNANEIWMALITVASGLGAFISAGFWQKQIIKYGNTRTLALSTFTQGSLLLLNAFMPNLIAVTLLNFCYGFSTLGLNTCLLNGLLQSTPDENRILYIGTYNTCTNITLFISPLISYALLNSFGIFWTFVAVAAMRYVGFFIVLLYYLVGKRKETKGAYEA